MTGSISEDDIIKRRLLVEGDSGTDDRQINKLIKFFVKWCNSPADASAAATVTNGNQNGNGGTLAVATEEESSDSIYEQMLATLSGVEFNLMRNKFIVEMNKMEQANYRALYERIKMEIERAKKKIIENKFELQHARKIRKNRQEYDVLAKQILEYPDRSEMQGTIKQLEEKVESLKKVEAEYYKKLDLRRKQFSVVLQSLSALKNLIDNDVKLEDILNNQISSASETVVSKPDANTGGNHVVAAEDKDVILKRRFEEAMDDVNDEDGATPTRQPTVAEVEMEEA